MVRKALFFTVLMTFFVSGVYASDTRVQTLAVGGFIEDDSDMFTNPALVAWYSNLVIGELGIYSSYYWDAESKQLDWCDCQWAGVTLGKDELALGVVFNRELPWVEEIGNFYMGPPFYYPEYPVNPIEVMVGYGMDGMAIGGRAYMIGGGYSEENVQNDTTWYTDERNSKLWDFAGGFAMDMGNDNQLEAYGNVGLFSFDAKEEYPVSDNVTEFKSDGGRYINAGGRYFLSMSPKHRVVPLAEFSTSSFTFSESWDDSTQETDYSMMSVKGGVGSEWKLSRKTLLAVAASVVYTKESMEYAAGHPAEGDMSEETALVLPMFQAGLETHLADWFIARMGVQKVHSKVTEKMTADYGAKQEVEYTETYTSSEWPSDFLSLGFGIRLDRLLIDATLMEDIPFTGTYLLSGIPGNLSGKITATYHF